MAVDFQWDRLGGSLAVVGTVIVVLGLLWLTGSAS
jgi:hypothetical protein